MQIRLLQNRKNSLRAFLPPPILFVPAFVLFFCFLFFFLFSFGFFLFVPRKAFPRALFFCTTPKNLSPFWSRKRDTPLYPYMPIPRALFFCTTSYLSVSGGKRFRILPVSFQRPYPVSFTGYYVSVKIRL